MNNEAIMKALTFNSELVEASLIQLSKELAQLPDDVESKETLLALAKYVLQTNTMDHGELILKIDSAGIDSDENFPHNNYHHTYKVPPVIWTLLLEAVVAANAEWSSGDLLTEQLDLLRFMRGAAMAGDITACVTAFNKTDQWTRQLISPVVIDWLNDQIKESKS